MKLRKTIVKAEIPGFSGSFLQVTLQCSDGFSVVLLSAGASIRQILWPRPDGVLQNIALSFSDSAAYLGNPLYAGATLAPCAGRIAGGRLPIHGRIYSLTKNENGRHTLHGGSSNASFRSWELLSESVCSTYARIVFGCVLPDGLDGFPGRRTLRAVYTLTEDRCLTLAYEAVSDRPTWFNLSNHSYFNLTGDFSRPALDHRLQIPAEQFLCNAPDFIPEAIASVEGTPFDFRQKKSLASQLAAYPDDIQLARNQGYNHGFLFSHGNRPADLSDSARMPDLICTAPQSAVRLEISSDAPCMVLYSGGYIPEGLALAGGQRSCPSCALAFEFQDYPDAPGDHGLPYTVTEAGERWQRRICYRFTDRQL